MTQQNDMNSEAPIVVDVYANYAGPDSDRFTWGMNLFEQGKPIHAVVAPPPWRTYKTKDGAMAAGRRMAKRLFDVEVYF